jgi:peptidase E
LRYVSNLMKILLLSGAPNDEIKENLKEMLPVESSSVKMAVVPTASLAHRDGATVDDSWVSQEIQLHMDIYGFGSAVRCDLDGNDPEAAIANILASDVLEMWGGNTGYLLEWVRRSGLGDKLISGIPDLVYLGGSAGSMQLGPTLEYVDRFFPGEMAYATDLTGLGLVPFLVIPHLNAEGHPRIRPPEIRAFAETVSYPVYALDNQCGVRVDDGEVTVIGGGEYLALNT